MLPWRLRMPSSSSLLLGLVLHSSSLVHVPFVKNFPVLPSVHPLWDSSNIHWGFLLKETLNPDVRIFSFSFGFTLLCSAT
jgi:hypothetical protein